jgi:hypothetical protein
MPCKSRSRTCTSYDVDSGQLLITDPCFIEREWLHEPYQGDGIYRDTQTGATVRWGHDFVRFDEPLEPYGKSPNDLIEAGRLAQLPPSRRPKTLNYSYNGAYQATLSEGYGELVHDTGAPAAGSCSRRAGDGFYPVYGEKHDGRIMRVYVNVGAEPVPLSHSAVFS